MSNYGAKPTGSSSPAAIVRFGFTSAQRALVAARDPKIIAELAAHHSRATLDEICVLCDRFVARKAA